MLTVIFSSYISINSPLVILLEGGHTHKMTLITPITRGSCIIAALAASATLAMANTPEITTESQQKMLPETIMPIPEPSTAAMIGLLGIALIFRKRK